MPPTFKKNLDNGPKNQFIPVLFCFKHKEQFLEKISNSKTVWNENNFFTNGNGNKNCFKGLQQKHLPNLPQPGQIWPAVSVELTLKHPTIALTSPTSFCNSFQKLF